MMPLKKLLHLFLSGWLFFILASAVMVPLANAANGFEYLQTLAGEWIAAEGDANQTVARYSVTANGTAVLETLFPGTPHEMITVYTREGNDVVLTHYCAAGNQPHMRAKPLKGHTLDFEFTGVDNAHYRSDMHMHSAKFDFISNNEFKSEWQSWDKGKASGDPKVFHLMRRAAF